METTRPVLPVGVDFRINNVKRGWPYRKYGAGLVSLMAKGCIWMLFTCGVFNEVCFSVQDVVHLSVPNVGRRTVTLLVADLSSIDTDIFCYNEEQTFNKTVCLRRIMFPYSYSHSPSYNSIISFCNSRRQIHVFTDYRVGLHYSLLFCLGNKALAGFEKDYRDCDGVWFLSVLGRFL